MFIVKQKEVTLRFGAQQSVHWMMVGLLIPVITLIFQSKGLNLQQIGFVMAAWIGSTTLLEIPLGSLADTYGRRGTYLVSLLLNSLGCFVLYLANEVTFVFLAAALLGASRAVYSGTLDAWFYDAFHQAQGKQTYHSALAKINVAVTIGLAVGSLIGGWLPDIASNSANVFSSIYDINLLGACIANIGLIVITLMLIDDRRPRRNTQPKQARENAFQLCTQALKVCWKHDVLSRLMQATVVFGMVLSSVENYWQPYLADILRETSSGVIAFGVISALYFIMSAVSSLISVPLLRVFSGSHKTLMFTTRALAGVCFIFLAYTAHLLSFTLCYLLFFFLLTVGNNSESVLLHENTKEKMRSTMLSISSFMVTCGGVLASLIFGVIAERFGISASWIINGALLVLSSVVFIFVSKRRELRVR